ncbi:hypothetical protein ACIQC9_07570 [Brevundimonas sp. NPDC092305]|uniref:hypothetical protein n=1 Tax=Brevundimonas sp. NPDC092305 TaxID=3363957 RepID=UPI0038055893
MAWRASNAGASLAGIRRLGLALAGLLAIAQPAHAGAWTKPKGKGLVIAKHEAMRADEGFDPLGQPVHLPAPRRDRSTGVFAEYGLSDRITVQFKGDWQSGEDAFVDYEGRGPLELGVTWQAWRDDRTAVSLYAAYADGGEGRNAGYAAPGQGDSDWEIRAEVGRRFDGRRWLPPGFVEIQAARRMRAGLPDETRLDLTLGAHVRPGWMVLSQAYAGQADRNGARWLTGETSVVKDFGPWSVQLGWRETVEGRETPRSRGPVIGIWRRF